MKLPEVQSWNPVSSDSWAATLGLVPVSLFAPGSGASQAGSHTVMLDGRAGSFLLSRFQDSSLAAQEEVASWCWSANVRHGVLVLEDQEEMRLVRWDAPPGTVRRFKIPSRPAGAIELLRVIESELDPRALDVVAYALNAFRQLRRELLPTASGATVVQAFNLLLLGVEKVKQAEIDPSHWKQLSHLGDLLNVLGEPSGMASAFNYSELWSFRDRPLGTVPSYLLHPEGISGHSLLPDLTLRHASSELYQEAHFVLEQETQLSFPGMPLLEEKFAEPRRDVRFTPAPLARSLAQIAIDSAWKRVHDRAEVSILDPACGSGIFLKEAVRELLLRKFKGKISLHGFDISEESCAMARFVMARLAQEALASGITITHEILQLDSLYADWGSPDVILMNPPFIPYQRMHESERAQVVNILGNVAKGRADMTMAFVWKACVQIAPGGAIASVVPAPLFENQAGEKWREQLMKTCQLDLLGRFKGYRFFQTSIVEPGMVVMTKTGEGAGQHATQILYSEPGYEGPALRALRTGTVDPAASQFYDRYEIPQSRLTAYSWLPKTRRALAFAQAIQSLPLPCVDDLFRVHLGAQAGVRKAYVLTERQYAAIPEVEKQWFRPIAGQGAIFSGQLLPKKYIFYPYTKQGLAIKTEEGLVESVPYFFRHYLAPHREALESRSRTDKSRWWAMREPGNWQFEPKPKLVSKAFGFKGDFAYDSSGECVVLQGNAWIWKSEKLKSVSFGESSLPLAYLAILNSDIFEGLLESFCPRIQGGQFELAKRYVGRIPLPDLADDQRLSSDLIEGLFREGQRIFATGVCDHETREDIVRACYGI